MDWKYENTFNLKGKRVIYSPYHKDKIKAIKNKQFSKYRRNVISLYIFLVLAVIIEIVFLRLLFGLSLDVFVILIGAKFLIILPLLGILVEKTRLLRKNKSAFILNDGILFFFADIRTILGTFRNPHFIPFDHIKEIKMKRDSEGKRMLGFLIKDEFEDDYSFDTKNSSFISKEHVPSIEKFKSLAEKQMESYQESLE